MSDMPDVPHNIAAQVEHAEKRRGWAVLACIVSGTLLGGLGIALIQVIASALALSLLALGVLIAFPLAALVALLLGPSWKQRRQHWQLLHWQLLHWQHERQHH